MKGKVLPIGIIAIVLIAGAYLILMAQQNQNPDYRTANGHLKPLEQSTIFNKQPLTVQNENQVLIQNDTAIDAQLNQIDKDLKVWDGTNISASSHDNVSSINSL